MKIRIISMPALVATATLALSSAGGCKESANGDAGDDDVIAVPTEEWILARAYDHTYRVPKNFYLDERAVTPRSYTVHHVLNESGEYERCADTFDSAYQWEATDHASRSASGAYVGAIENERYFEFIRELYYEDDVGNVGDLTSPSFARVFKCSYITREGVNRNQRNGYAGTLPVQPITANTVKQLTEYLWQFTYFWPARAIVLETFSSESGVSTSHTLRLALLVNQGDGQCDRIEVVDWTFSVNVANGATEKRYKIQHVFEARLVDGHPQTCSV